MARSQLVAGIAFVGCGFVADFYLATMANHPNLRLIGVFDRDRERGNALASHHRLMQYRDLEALLGDDRVEIVVNLTSPENHYEVSLQALLADKHVYSEKPLATTYQAAEAIVSLAERRDLVLSSAPCSLLSETAQTLWRAVRRGDIGRPQLAYAQLDDGALHRMPYKTWRSVSGAPWPYRTELKTGCTLEHGAYYLTWLSALFGPVTEVRAFAANIVADVLEVETPGPDFATAGLKFQAGVSARVTCSIIAPSDHSLTLVGEEGVLHTADAWDYGSPIHIRRARPLGTPGHLRLKEPTIYPLVRPADFPHRYEGFHQMDFCRGIAEVADAVAERRPSRLSARHALHALDIALAMSAGQSRTFSTSLDPVAPMPWASDEAGGDRGPIYAEAARST